ncbi:MAG: polysaccharide biosynthesis C-terminal domain-containing protein [Dokdonia sp.]|nr:polysaccharide biosynthesis C-terminal domain-containing protein [Dokdonia sp.]
MYGLATVLPRLLTMLLTPLYVAYLANPAAFGKVTEVFAFIMILNVLLTYGMETSFFRFYSDKQYGLKSLSTALLSLLVTTIIAAGVSYAGIESISEWTNVASTYWKWVIGIIALDTLTVIPFAYLRAQKKSMKYAIIKLFNVFISVGLATFFLIFLPQVPLLNQWLPKDEIALVFIAFFVASLVMFVIMSGVYFRKHEFDLRLWKKMGAYGLPILIAGIAFAINESIDKILLPRLLPEDIGETQLGIYAACYRLSVGMTLFATAFKLGVEPFFFSEAKNTNAKEMYAQITKVFVILGAIVLLVYIVLVDIIKPILIPKEVYWEAMHIVPLILIAYLFFGIYQTLSVWYKVTDQTKYGAYISVAGAMLTIIINIALIPRVGYLASAIATLGAYGLMMVISYLMGRKHLAIPYDIKNIILYVVLSVVFSVTFFYYFREYFGIGSWQLYLVGTFMTVVLIGVISFREKTFIRSLLRRQ